MMQNSVPSTEFESIPNKASSIVPNTDSKSYHEGGEDQLDSDRAIVKTSKNEKSKDIES